MSRSVLWDLLKYSQSLWLNLINHSEVEVTCVSGLLSGVLRINYLLPRLWDVILLVCHFQLCKLNEKSVRSFEVRSAHEAMSLVSSVRLTVAECFLICTQKPPSLGVSCCGASGGLQILG